MVPPMDTVARQAIDWMVLLRSGNASPEDAHAFADWRARDARHDEVCCRIERVLGDLAHFEAIPDVARQVLQRKRTPGDATEPL